MRPHNCGHWTIEGARTSQFEQHLRAVLDLPLGSPALAAPGYRDGQRARRRRRRTSTTAYIHVMAADPAVKVHMYGKPVRPGRKIGHVTVTGQPDLAELARPRPPRRQLPALGTSRTASDRRGPPPSSES